MSKVIYRTAPDEEFTVWDVYYGLVPVYNLTKDRNGRTVQITAKVLSHNGRHVICRDYGLIRDDLSYLDDLIVDKVIVDGAEYKIYLRKTKRRKAAA